MNVTMVAPYFPPEGGGLEVYVRQVARLLLERHGVRVTVICSRVGRGPAHQETLDGIRIHRLPFLFRIFTTPVHPMWFRAIGEILDRERPDLVNGHLPVPYMADIAARSAFRRGIPFVLTCHGSLARSARTSVLAGGYFLALGRGTLRRSRRIIANSPQTAVGFHRLLGTVYRSRLTVIPPGVDPSVFHPKECKEAGNGKVLLFVGNLGESSGKGLDTLIRALPIIRGKVPDVKLVVVGSGPSEGYRRMAERLGVGDRVEYAGRIPHASLPEYYHRADLVVFPSRNPAEGFGMALIEAQACRRPVVGSRVGGVPHAVSDGETGLLVNPGCHEELAGAILRLLGDKKLADDLAERGYRRVLVEFTWDRVASRTFETYQQAIGSKR